MEDGLLYEGSFCALAWRPFWKIACTDWLELNATVQVGVEPAQSPPDQPVNMSRFVLVAVAVRVTLVPAG